MKKGASSNSEFKNKIFIAIIFLIFSIYFSTLFHEVGHAIPMYVYGCQIPVPYVTPFIIGATYCAHPEEDIFREPLLQFEKILILFGGILLISLIGIIFFLLYKFSSYVRESYSLSLFTYFFSFSSLGNGFLQSISSSDLYSLVEYYGFNPVYSYIVAIILGILMVWLLLDFKKLLRRVEPRIKDKSIERINIIWIFLVLIYVGGYLLLPYLL